VIDYVKHYLTTMHRAVSAAYEREVNDLAATAFLHVLRILDIPLIYFLLRGAKLGERRALLWISGSETWRSALKVRPPHEIHRVNMIQSPQDTSKHDWTRLRQFLAGQIGQRFIEAIIRPRGIP
jgi:hypothetical protein